VCSSDLRENKRRTSGTRRSIKREQEKDFRNKKHKERTREGLQEQEEA
jgi:hypothetical protein